MNLNIQWIALCCLSLFLCSCGKYPADVKRAVDLAGSNAGELEKVIEHYSSNPEDSLKLRAAYFLIANMPGKFYYEGDLIDRYYEFIDKVEKSPSAIDSIRKIHGAFHLDSLLLKYDLKELKSPFLISNIDMAFKVWREQPWGKDINFEQFCEYILPYRNGNEVPAYNRVEFYKKYAPVLDSLRHNNGTALQACYAVNNELKKEGWAFFIQGGFLPYFSAEKLLNQKKGNCRDMVSKTLFVMRSLGIPVSSEFTPNWGNRNGGHMWNVVLDSQGKNHPFMGTENNDSRELEGGTHYKFAKVFQNTFGLQHYSEGLIKDGHNDFPELFRNRYIKDVTAEVGGVDSISPKLDPQRSPLYDFAYLCVFDNVKWVPVDWAKISGGRAIFKNMMGNVVYLAAYYKGGSLIPAGDPFLLHENGKMDELSPDDNQKESLTLWRKYPVFMKGDYARFMKGGKMQAADDVHFSNPHTIYVVPYPEVEMKWYSVPVSVNRPYKYYRYLSPDGGFGNIAELQFYADGKRVKGRPVGTPGSYFNRPENYFTTAFDGDESTFFNYKESGNGWTGLELEKKTAIQQIRFLPRNDDNGIAIGQRYQLLYWQNKRWTSAGIRVALEDSLIYDNIPKGSLLRLRNLSKGKEERIFTYNNGKQVWW